MQVVTGNAAMSIALRNAIFKCIPAAFINPIIEKCKEAAKGDKASLPKRRDAAIAWFYTKGITTEQICEHLDVPNVEEITLEMLATLSGYKSSVVNDGADVKEIFGLTKKEKVEEKKAAMKEKSASSSKKTGKSTEKKTTDPKVDANGQGQMDMP